MGKKPDAIKELSKPDIIRVGDKVMTPISERAGKVVRIEEKENCGGWVVVVDGVRQNNTIREFTVEIPFPELKSNSFKFVTIVLRDYEITRATA
jgi:hypothetical protein